MNLIESYLANSRWSDRKPDWLHHNCVKSVQIRNFFWFVFSCIRTEYKDLQSKSEYSVQSKHRKIRPRKNSVICTLSTQCIISQDNKKIIKNSLSYQSADVGSDHSLVTANVELKENLTKETKNERKVTWCRKTCKWSKSGWQVQSNN